MCLANSISCTIILKKNTKIHLSYTVTFLYREFCCGISNFPHHTKQNYLRCQKNHALNVTIWHPSCDLVRVRPGCINAGTLDKIRVLVTLHYHNKFPILRVCALHVYNALAQSSNLWILMQRQEFNVRNRPFLSLEGGVQQQNEQILVLLGAKCFFLRQSHSLELVIFACCDPSAFAFYSKSLPKIALLHLSFFYS
jgi:hypothetical protein